METGRALGHKRLRGTMGAHHSSTFLTHPSLQRFWPLSSAPTFFSHIPRTTQSSRYGSVLHLHNWADSPSAPYRYSMCISSRCGRGCARNYVLKTGSDRVEESNHGYYIRPQCKGRSPSNAKRRYRARQDRCAYYWEISDRLPGHNSGEPWVGRLWDDHEAKWLATCARQLQYED